MCEREKEKNIERDYVVEREIERVRKRKKCRPPGKSIFFAMEKCHKQYETSSGRLAKRTHLYRCVEVGRQAAERVTIF